MKTLKFLPLFFALLAVGCSPYETNSFIQAMERTNQQNYSQQQQISSQYMAGLQKAPAYIVPPSYIQKNQAFSQYNQSLQKQQEIDAYNQRTRALSQPQQLNLNHSGTINHNIYGY